MAKQLDLYEQIARVAHEAVGEWRELRGERRIAWVNSRKRRPYVEHVKAVVAGASVTDLHTARQEAKLVDPKQSVGAALKETALVHATAQTLGCGQERWDIKTGTDPDAESVLLTPKSSTIGELIAFPAPPPDPPARVQGEPEFQVYTIEATVTAWKIESDSDYHLALADAQGNTMIAEAACPGCAQGSPWLDQITTVRSTIETALGQAGPGYVDVNRLATISGPGMFDRLHGQRGVAPNGIEIHPILSIEFA